MSRYSSGRRSRGPTSNRVEAVLAMCAIEKLGGVVTPLMPMYREKELKYISRVGGMKKRYLCRGSIEESTMIGWRRLC